MSTETAKSWLTVLLTAIGSFFSKLASSFKLSFRQTWSMMGWIAAVCFAVVATLGLYVGIVGAAPWSWIPMAMLHDWSLMTGYTIVLSILGNTIFNMFRFEDKVEVEAYQAEEEPESDSEFDQRAYDAWKNVKAVPL